MKRVMNLTTYRKRLLICWRVVEELRKKPEKFSWCEALSQAIRYHVVGANVFWRYLLGCVEEADVVFFEGYVSGFSCYLWCNSEVDCGLVVLQYHCWIALRESYVCSKLAEVLNVLGAPAQGQVFRLTGAEECCSS